MASGSDPVIDRGASSMVDVQRVGVGSCEIFSIILLCITETFGMQCIHQYLRDGNNVI